MWLVDTNVLVYVANEDAPEHVACARLLDSWRGAVHPWYTTWGILYEFMKVVTHPRLLPKPWKAARALQFVRALLASPSLDLLAPGERHEAILAETIADVPGIAGGFFHDLRTAVLMREHVIRRIVTRDRGFARFPFLEVLDPLEMRG